MIYDLVKHCASFNRMSQSTDVSFFFFAAHSSPALFDNDKQRPRIRSASSGPFASTLAGRYLAPIAGAAAIEFSLPWRPLRLPVTIKCDDAIYRNASLCGLECEGVVFSKDGRARVDHHRLLPAGSFKVLVVPVRTRFLLSLFFLS